MDSPQSAHSVRTLEQLQALFGPVGEASSRKEVDFIHPQYRAMIEASPFAILATAGPDGLDASPRGECARAIQRSRLWQAPPAGRAIPTAGAVLESLTDAAIDGAKYDADLPARQRATLY